MAASTSTSSSSTEPKEYTRTTQHPLQTSSTLLSQFSAPLASRSYSRQYAALYDFRLRKLRKSRLLGKAKAKWEDAGTEEEADATPTPRFTPRILDVKTGQVTYVIGIVYTEMRLKPDVLQDLTREQYLPPLPPVTSYSDPESDSIYLEDESGRLKLVGPLLSDPQHAGQWITGTVGAFLGTERENGEFHVLEVCWPGLHAGGSGATASSRTEANKKVKLDDDDDDAHADDDTYAVLLSGLDIGSDSDSLLSETRLALLVEWLSGEMGDADLASRVCSVIVAGNLMSLRAGGGGATSGSSTTTADAAGLTNGSEASTTTASSSSRKGAQHASAAANRALTPNPPSVLLSHLLPLSASLPIVLMPGSSDPSAAALPQQAIHRAILPGTQKYSAPEGGINLYNNPSWIQLGGDGACDILATSGQSLDDLAKYTSASASSTAPTPTTRLEMAMNLLRFGHIAPTCPDTMYCYPFNDRDPFIIEHVPQVFVVGNQPEYATGVYAEAEDDRGSNAVRVVLLPKFSRTGQVVLLNLRTRGVKVVTIGWECAEAEQ